MTDIEKQQNEALRRAKEALTDLSVCVGFDHIERCFNCDEFMHLAVWPEHGDPNCVVGLALKSIELALTAFKEKQEQQTERSRACRDGIISS